LRLPAAAAAIAQQDDNGVRHRDAAIAKRVAFGADKASHVPTTESAITAVDTAN